MALKPQEWGFIVWATHLPNHYKIIRPYDSKKAIFTHSSCYHKVMSSLFAQTEYFPKFTQKKVDLTAEVQNEPCIVVEFRGTCTSCKTSLECLDDETDLWHLEPLSILSLF